MEAGKIHQRMISFDGDRYILTTPSIEMWNFMQKKSHAMPDIYHTEMCQEPWFLCQDNGEIIAAFTTEETVFTKETRLLAVFKGNIYRSNLSNKDCMAPFLWRPCLVPLNRLDKQDDSLCSNPDGTLVTGGTLWLPDSGVQSISSGPYHEWEGEYVSEYREYGKELFSVGDSDGEHDMLWMYCQGCLISVYPWFKINALDLVFLDLATCKPNWLF